MMGDGGVRGHSIPLDILDDLAARFIINLPEEERTDPIRLCFQLELAHWFYLDEYAKSSPTLRPCSLREFAEHLFRHVQSIAHFAQNVEDVLQNWKDYKVKVPTYGAIILNDDLTKVLLVKGYNSRSSWSFPKGKVNEEEAPHVCAIREVFEETGFDIGSMISSEHYLTSIINDQTVTLFLVPFAKEGFPFAPRTKYEIKDIQWFPIDLLPTSKKEEMKANNLGLSASNLFTVIPFVRALQKWVVVFKRGHFQNIHTPINERASSQPRAAARTTPKGQPRNKQSHQASPYSASTSLAKASLQSPPKPIPVKRAGSQQVQGMETAIFKPIEAWKNFRFNTAEIMAAMNSVNA